MTNRDKAYPATVRGRCARVYFESMPLFGIESRVPFETFYRGVLRDKRAQRIAANHGRALSRKAGA